MSIKKIAQLIVEHVDEVLNERYHEEDGEIMYGTWSNFKKVNHPIRWGEHDLLFWGDGRGDIFEVTSSIRREFEDAVDDFEPLEDILEKIDEGSGSWLYDWTDVADDYSVEEVKRVEALFDKYFPRWSDVRVIGESLRRTKDWTLVHSKMRF